VTFSFPPETKLECLSMLPYVRSSKLETDRDKLVSRQVLALKDGKRVVVGGVPRAAARWFCEELERARKFDAIATEVDDVFRGGPALVPIPRHSVTPAQPPYPGWSSFALAKELVSSGFGKDVVVAIRRVVEVPSSTQAAREGRSRTDVATHLASFRCTTDELRSRRIVLIDDTVSRGDTSMAAFLGLRGAGFEGAASLFTAAYLADPGSPEFDGTLFSPRSGTISYRDGLSCHRI
jgi:hypothetical protein